MSYDAAPTAVYARANSLWPTIESTVGLDTGQENFQFPLDADNSPLPWLKVELVWSDGELMSIGDPGRNLVRRSGIIWAMAFIPQGTGEVRAHQIAARAASMFELQSFGGVVCDAGAPGGPVSSENGNYFGQSVSIPFDYDESA